MSNESVTSQNEQQEREANIADSHLALRIAREVALHLNIPDIKTIQPLPFEENWRTFVEHQDTDIVLIIEFSFLFLYPTSRISLSSISYLLLREIKSTFDSKNAAKYLDIPTSEPEEFICWMVKDFLVDFVRHLPLVLSHSISQTLKENIINRIRKFVEPDLREHWRDLELPKDFELVQKDSLDNFAELFPDSNLTLLGFLEDNDRRFSAYRKIAFANRRGWLTDEALLALPGDYKRLKFEYNEAKKFHDKTEEIFHRNNNKAEIDGWKNYWQSQSEALYPHLTELDKVNDYLPYQLAELHLAKTYDYSHDSIITKIREAKKLVEERKRREQSTK